MSDENRESRSEGGEQERRSGQDRRQGEDRRKEQRADWSTPTLRRLERRQGGDRRSGQDRRQK